MITLDQNFKNVFLIEGKVQNYDWGGKKFIPNLISKKKSMATYAEYWLGAHLKAPSTIRTKRGNFSLDFFLKQKPIEFLGLRVANTFGKLPYLFKVLDVNKMLSIQVHPTKKAAEIGFDLENKRGVALTAKNRNYKDRNHKPEVMVALSDFWLLHGFLQRGKLIRNLKETSELNFLLDTFKENNYFELYKMVMEFSQERVNTILKPLAERILPKFLNNELEKTSPEYWAAKALVNKSSKNIDRGIFSIYFFNIVNLSKGEAVFQDAGLPHAYLEGKNIELMANSDNVLRGGLTSKYIDVEELLKNTKFEETIPNVLYGVKNYANNELVYRTKAKDFKLSKIELAKDLKYKSKSKSVEILIILEGSATVIQNLNRINIDKGQSILIKANTNYKIISSKGVEIYKASVPEQK
ncbi:mannose-6-phosphate isomerase, class I [Tenacibaculum sp. AHE15PA]|uniref:mannose-6-phosphate isomerase, class I n=1 Tax=unclassified Tenacibaculum TaxID=2635139 RepID=UPI001C500F05|nr:MULTISPECIES: mannose-6-phosphate isomerase, class I [unclassified Tenacibaculum]QXP73690.1 mannose-6-phosphate isomerase, class I [Tenacibaculum sp. AHE14PA]QXP75943.1 mannose-6-phosphate isomerase, class I [Tenacibaculum sp. AHE15PA]